MKIDAEVDSTRQISHNLILTCWQAGTTFVEPEDAMKIFYHDLPDAQADVWARKFKPWSVACAFSISTYAAWRLIPSTNVICENDQSAFGMFARPLLEAAKASEPCAVDTVEEADSGHMVMVSQPKWTAEMLKRAAEAC